MAPGSSFKHFLGRFAIALVARAGRDRGRRRRPATGSSRTASSTRSRRSHIRDDVLVPSENGRARELPDHRLRHAAPSSQTEQQAQAFGTADGGRRPALRRDDGRARRARRRRRASSCRSRATCGSTIPGHGENRLNAALELGGPVAPDRDACERTSTCRSSTTSRSTSRASRRSSTRSAHVEDLLPDAGARRRSTGLDQPEAGCQSLDGGAGARVRARRATTRSRATACDPTRDRRLARRTRAATSTASSASSTSCAASRRPRSTSGASNPATAIALLDDISDALHEGPEPRATTTSRRSSTRSATSIRRASRCRRCRSSARPSGDAQVRRAEVARRASRCSTGLRTFATRRSRCRQPAAPDEVQVVVVERLRRRRVRRRACSTRLVAHGFDVGGSGRRRRPQRLPEDPGPLDGAGQGAEGAHRRRRTSAPRNVGRGRDRAATDRRRRARDRRARLGRTARDRCKRPSAPSATASADDHRAVDARSPTTTTTTTTATSPSTRRRGPGRPDDRRPARRLPVEPAGRAAR